MNEQRLGMKVGREYDVYLSDCCIQGKLHGELLAIEPQVGDGEIFDHRFIFDFGWLGPDWGKWEARESS